MDQLSICSGIIIGPLGQRLYVIQQMGKRGNILIIVIQILRLNQEILGLHYVLMVLHLTVNLHLHIHAGL